ncbi:MAG: hypothetical protein F4187_06475 [Gemmatimonadetes bacterium]|nr:hypothetical protein [Acidobacteriota bacterium]MYG81419.1 hypothetical protein [Gemmatimonadota bacterium]MYI06142.1 hypothetical protein [Gemmatimonadota bacterium]
MSKRSYERSISLKSAVDLQVVGENILDVADFAIEKYEFEHDTTLSEEHREAAIETIRDDLWDLVKDFRARRKQWLQMMFDTADKAVRKAVDAS